tara:strand:+ start:573 stop:1181 length:609 start_codon:yes stop_codon:yes gene_type:complete
MYEWVNNMKKLFENWNTYINENLPTTTRVVKGQAEPQQQPDALGNVTRIVPAEPQQQDQKKTAAAVKQATVKASALAAKLQQVLKSLQGALSEARISFDDLIVETGNTKQGILGAYQDVLDGTRSRTPEAPIKVNWIEEEQKFLVVDGLHRLVEFIEKGQTSCYCEIDWNSGSGKWKLPVKEERLKNFSLNELKRSMNGLTK